MMANGAMGSESGGGVGECNFILLLMGTVIHYKLVLLITNINGYLGYFTKNVGI